MKASKTLVLLTLAALAQESLAHAQIKDEQQFQVGSVELSLGAGLLNGQAQEKFYDSYDGKKISQLNWDLKQVPTLHLGLAYHPTDSLTLEARGWTKIAKGDGHMKDYDWLSDEHAEWSHFSDHPDTRVQKAWQAEFAATLWAIKRDDLALGVLLGYQRNEFGWQARGGSLTYSSDEGFRDISETIPDGVKGITYEQSYDTPYVGLVGLYTYKDWTLEGRLKHSQWVRARDYDQHHLRDITFTGNNGNEGRMQSLALGLSYRFNPQFSLKAGVDYQMHAEAKGGTLVKDLEDGERRYYGGKSGSQASRTVLSSLALNYRF